MRLLPLLFIIGCSFSNIYSTESECKKECSFCRKTITNQYQCRTREQVYSDTILETQSDVRFRLQDDNK